MSEHEYTVVGHSRSKIGICIAFFSGLLAGGSVTLIGLAMTFAKNSGLSNIPEVIFWPFTGSAISAILLLLFDKFFWRWKLLKFAVGIPDIEGEWTLNGLSYEQSQSSPRAWRGKIEITQKYEKIFVCLITEQSRSHSISAALVPEGKRFRLIYSYKNQPQPGQVELQHHIGHCEILFESDLKSADGNYFNGRGRFTHGSMQLERKI